MLNPNELVDLLERYERFLINYAVTVFRLLGDTHPNVELKLLGIIKGSVFPVPIDVFSHHLERLTDHDLARRKAAEAVIERYQIHREIVGFLSQEVSPEIALRPMHDSVAKGETFERGFALTSLACQGDADSREALLADLEGMPRLLRWGILTILDYQGDIQWMPLFLGNLEDTEPDVARVAISALGRSGTASAAAKLQELLGHASEMIVIAAVQTLARLNNPGSILPMKELFYTSKSPKVRATLISAFGEFQDPSTTAILVDGMNNPDARTRANAVLALKRRSLNSGAGPDQAILSRMKELLRDPDNRVRADAVQALWELGGGDSAGVLEELVQSPNEGDRNSGAYLCGKLKLARFKEHLVRLTDDSSWNVRKTSAIALLGLGETGLVLLKTLMYHGTPNQQVCAAYATGLADDPQGVDLLLAESRSGSEMAEMATDLLLRLSKPCEGKPPATPDEG